MLVSGAGRSRLREINGLPDHPHAGGSFHTATFGNEKNRACEDFEQIPPLLQSLQWRHKVLGPMVYYTG